MDFKKFNLNNSVAFITGAGGFLGLQHAEALLKSGATVVLSDISKESLEKSTDCLKNRYELGKIYQIYADVTSPHSIKEAKKIINDKNLFVDILINNAAIDPKVKEDLNLNASSRLESFDLIEWDKQIAVGLTGALNCIKIFGADMAQSKKNCVILNIASDLSVIAPDQKESIKNKVLGKNLNR